MKNVLFPSIYLAVMAIATFSGGCDYATTPDINCVESASFEFIRTDTGNCSSGCTYRFLATVVGGSDLRYTWDFGDNSTSDAAEPEHTYAQAGTYQVSLVIAQDACANEVVPTKPLTIGFPAPVAKITTAQPAVYTMPVTTVNFDANASQNAVSYSWDFGDGGTATGATASHAYARPDTFMVVLKAVGQGGDQDRDTIWVRIEPKTFLLTSDVAAGVFERAVLTDEASDGSFRAATSTSDALYLVKISATGALQGSPNLVDYPIGSAYINGAQNIFCTRKTANGYILVGNVENTLNPLDINTDIYALTLKSDFTVQNFPNPLFDNIPGVGNGNETGRFVIERDGGYVIAGDQDFGAGGPPKRFYYMKLSGGLSKVGNAMVRSETNTQEQRRIYTIANNGTGYVITGKKGAFTFFARLDADFNVIGTERNLGNFIPSDMIALENNTYLLIGTDGASGKVFKLDASGNDLSGWPVSLPNTVLYKGLVTNKGRLALAGGISDGVAFLPYLVQLKISDGAAAVAPQTFPAGTLSRRLYYLAQTRDDGFILGGEDESGSTLFIRTNHLGQLIQ
ncbi:MAG: PKD domain-containing protein [Bacteroidetes bacterium]|nr:PKD domain-containing protein [Bacteroidota bacterium]